MEQSYFCRRYPHLKIAKGGGRVIEFVDGRYETEDEFEQEIIERVSANNAIFRAEQLAPNADEVVIPRAELEELRAFKAMREGRGTEETDVPSPPDEESKKQGDFTLNPQEADPDNPPEADEKDEGKGPSKGGSHLGRRSTANMSGR